MRILLSICVVITGLAPALADDATNAKSVSNWIKQLNSPQVKSRQEAAEALGRMGPAAASAVPALIKALEDWRVREPACKALARIGPKALPALRQLFAHDSHMSAIAEDIMSRMGRKAVPYLMAVLREKEGKAHYHAILALHNMGPEAAEAIPLLVQVMKSRKFSLTCPSWFETDCVLDEDSHRARSTAAQVLAQMGPKALPEVMRVFQEKPAKAAAWELPWHLATRGWGFLPEMAQAGLPKLLDDPIAVRAWLDKQLKLLQQDMNDPGCHSRYLAATYLCYRSYEKQPPDRRELVAAMIQAAQDRDGWVRVQACRALQRMGPQAREAIPALIAVITNRRSYQDANDDPAKAVSALVAMGPEGMDQLIKHGLPILLEGLHDKNLQVRYKCVNAIHSIGRPAKAAIPALVKILREETQFVRGIETRLRTEERGQLMQVTWITLGSMAPDNIEPLREMLKDPEMRLHALNMFVMMGRWARPAVCDLIVVLGDREPRNRARAAGCLEGIGKPAWAAIPALRKALKGKDDFVAIAAATALLTVDPGCQEPLWLFSRLLWKDPGTLNSISITLSRLGPKAKPVAPALLNICRQKDIDHRYFLAAVWNLWQIDPDQVQPILSKLRKMVEKGDLQAANTLVNMDVKDPVLLPAFHQALRRGLYRSSLVEKAPKAVPVVIECLKDESHHQAAADTLGRIGPAAAAAVPELMEGLKYPEYHRRPAIQALGRIGAGSDKVLPCLVQLLQDPEEIHRQTVIEALAAMGPAARPAAPALSKWLQDEKLRVFAADALWHITGKVEPSLTVLIQELDSKNEETQQRALQALIKLGPKATPAVPKLRLLLQHLPDSNVPLYAAEALKQIGPGARPAIKELLRLLSSENQYYRTAAAEALGEIGGATQIPPLVVMVEEEGVTAVAEAGELALNKIRFRMKTGRR